MKHLALPVGLGVVLAFVSTANADYLEVRRETWLKRSPTAEGAKLKKLSTGTLVELTKETQREGYYSVKTRDGLAGYVYRTLVARHAGALPPDESSSNSGQPDEPITVPTASTCGGAPLTVRFFDVGQALAVLVELPDHRRILVDAGEAANRCGAPCRAWSSHLLAALAESLPTPKLDALWITHQHSDHLGGAVDVLNKFRVATYVDNGTDLDKTTVKKARAAAVASGATIAVVDPQRPESPIASGGDVTLSAVVPSKWPSSCTTSPNNCSIGLRIDYCKSSVLFPGDAEQEEEALLNPVGPVGLLQVGHHGSNTSSSDAFIKKLRPEYAVVSSGKPEEGTNEGYCHPIASTVTKLTNVTGGPGSKSLTSFDATNVNCKHGGPANWVDIPTSDHLWATSRDGDVVLITTGDGVFRRVR